MTKDLGGLFLVVLLALVSPQAPPQAPPQTRPVFRGGTLIVPLDVTVLDKDGRPVTDLKQSEFTVFENDLKQDLRSFFPEPFTARAVPAGDGGILNRSIKPDPLVPQTRRTFLMVLGYGRIQYPARAVDGAMTFVRDHLLPQDLVAVLGFNRATDFTTTREDVLPVLERYKRDHERIIKDIGEFRLMHPRTPLPPEIQAEIDAVFTGQTTADALESIKAPRATPGTHMRDATGMLLGMDQVQRLNEPAWHRQVTFDEIQAALPVGVTLSDEMIGSDELKLLAGIEYLHDLEGAKQIVLLGRRLSFVHKEDDQLLASRANDARVVLNMIHTTGVENPPAAGRPIRPLVPNSSGGPVLEISSSMNIAEGTGGYYTGVTYADKALAHIDQMTRFSYLLGYAPTNARLDGTLRHVQVKVNRPGMTVLFHHDYYALEKLPALDLQQLVAMTRLARAGGYDSTAKDIRLQVTASAIPHLGGAAELRVDVTIDAARLAFAPTPAGKTAALDVEIFCGDEKEKLVGDLKQHLDVTADDDTYARFLKDGIPFAARVPITAPAKFVKVVVYDSGADLVGTFTLTIGK